ncbi:MAG: VTT domain-containing protein [Anaerolineae bacterium]|nr:VTT domain-containing protein [Anaerolineae bacterium]
MLRMKTSHKRWLLALLLVALAVLLVVYWQPLMTLLRDRGQLQAWLRGLGPWGPLALIALNAAQIVLAPVPGQLVQAVAGYLFGLWPGAIYGTLGMALGGTLSMSLGRFYGRPLVARLVGAERLARWERLVHADSPLVWCVLMLPPFGDIPFLVAGLSKMPIWKVLSITLVVRGPSVVLYAAVGAGAISGPSYLLGTIVMALALIAVLGLLYGARVQAWIEEHVLRRLTAGGDPSEEAAQEGE